MLELMVGFGVRITRPSKNFADPLATQVSLIACIFFNLGKSGIERSEISFFTAGEEICEHHDPMEKYADHNSIPFDVKETIVIAGTPLLCFNLPFYYCEI